MNILFCNFFKKSTNHYLELKENLLFLVFRLGLKGFPRFHWSKSNRNYLVYKVDLVRTGSEWKT